MENALTITATAADVDTHDSSTARPSGLDSNGLKLCHYLGLSEEALCLIRQLHSLGLTGDDIMQLKRLALATKGQDLDFVRNCKPIMERCDSLCEQMKKRCLSIESLVKSTCCPAQNVFGTATIDEYSHNTHVNLESIVADFDSNFVNVYPVPPGQAIRLEHQARPGFFPTTVEIDLDLANNGTNYLDIEIQFYIGPGGKEKGKAIGDKFKGSQFMDKDGRKKEVQFPKWRGKHLDVGSVEKISVELRHKGIANNLISANVFVHHDADCYYKMCIAGICEM
ncbi:MAG: hypothetical protein R3A51_16410 [Nannocystaceae bacterium]